MLSTMVYADEIVDPAEIGGFAILDDIATDERELKMAEQLIATLAADFDPSVHTDTHREAVLDLIERKAAGESPSVVAAPAAASDTVVDLMAALEKSVAAAKVARGRHPSSGAPADGDADPGSDEDADEDEDGATGSARETETKAPERAAKRAAKRARKSA
jgi:DNA end-binding protein Ku